MSCYVLITLHPLHMYCFQRNTYLQESWTNNIYRHFFTVVKCKNIQWLSIK